MAARALVDGEAAAQAARKRSVDDIKRLLDILDEQGPALQSEEALADLDFRFHKEVARIADNAFLSMMIDALAAPIREFLTCYVKVHKDFQSVIDRHRPILDAIGDRDAERAREAAVKHLETCGRTVASIAADEPAS
jgi:DNA-binding GntR family transcriptional regulator